METNPLSVTSFANIFSQSVGLLFILFIVSFAVQIDGEEIHFEDKAIGRVAYVNAAKRKPRLRRREQRGQKLMEFKMCRERSFSGHGQSRVDIHGSYKRSMFVSKGKGSAFSRL